VPPSSARGAVRAERVGGWETEEEDEQEAKQHGSSCFHSLKEICRPLALLCERERVRARSMVSSLSRRQLEPSRATRSAHPEPLVNVRLLTAIHQRNVQANSL